MNWFWFIGGVWLYLNGVVAVYSYCRTCTPCIFWRNVAGGFMWPVWLPALMLFRWLER